MSIDNENAAISADDRETIEAFRTYIEDSIATDDRYGPAVRQDRQEEGRFVSRWTIVPSCWFEVCVCASPPSIRVSFLTDDAARFDAIHDSVKESEQSLGDYVAAALGDASYSGPAPSVEQDRTDDLMRTSAAVALEELRDIDDDAVRDNTMRILEGFMIAFAAALATDDEGD